MDNLSDTLKKLKITAVDKTEDSLEGCLDCLLQALAQNKFMRIPCVDAGLISPLVQLLNSKDQEVLLQTGRALGNICYDSHSLQAQLINMGVIPTLVKLLGIHCQNAALTEMCLVAFGNLAEL
ncbi:RAP1GDS1 isoform 1, partial [Pan troglodytes]